MSAIPLTVFLSLALAGLFTVLFWREHRRRHLGGAERDSLLPLADESPRLASLRGQGAASKLLPHMRQKFGRGPDDNAPDHGHAIDDRHDDPAADGGPCGCRTGLRAPCAGCLRQAENLR